MGTGSRPLWKPVGKGLGVLVGQRGGGAQYGHWITIGDSDKGGTQCDFCFAKANIAANQAVHGLTGLHVMDDCLYRSLLIRGRLKTKPITKSLVILHGYIKALTLAGGTLSIQC